MDFLLYFALFLIFGPYVAIRGRSGHIRIEWKGFLYYFLEKLVEIVYGLKKTKPGMREEKQC